MIDYNRLTKKRLIEVVMKQREAVFKIGKLLGLTESRTCFPTIEEEIEKLKMINKGALEENKGLRKTSGKYHELLRDVDHALEGTPEQEMPTKAAIEALVISRECWEQEVNDIIRKLGEAYLEKLTEKAK